MSAEVYEWVRNKELNCYECELQDVSIVIVKRNPGEWMVGTRKFASTTAVQTGPFKTLKAAKASCGDENDTPPVGFENRNDEFTRADKRSAEMAPGMAPQLYWQLYNKAKKDDTPVPIFKSAKAAKYGGQFMHPDGVIRPTTPESPSHEEAMKPNGEVAVTIRTDWSAIAATALGTAAVTSIVWLMAVVANWA